MSDPPAPGSDVRSALDHLESLGHPVSRVEPLAGDLSIRSHWRLHTDAETAVLTVYPSSLRHQCTRFRKSSTLLERVDVPTPGILRSHCTEGWMLVEDVGPSTWFERYGETEPEGARDLYERALRYLMRIQSLSVPEVDAINPRLGSRALRQEIRRSWAALLAPEGLVGEGRVRRRLSEAFDALCDSLESSGLVPAHRDFMVRNLIPVPDPRRLVVLDHQDLRLAPPAYDVASLLNDSLFPPAELEGQLLGLVPSVGRRDYRRAVVQRCIKAIGNYREASQRGRPIREPLVLPTLERAWRQMKRLPEFSDLVSPLAPRWERFLAGSSG